VHAAAGRHEAALELARGTPAAGLAGAVAAGFFAAWARAAEAPGEREEARRALREGRGVVDRHVPAGDPEARAATLRVPGYRDLAATAAALGELW
jgi:hypothetical protein